MSNLQGREQKALTEAEVEAFLESYSLFNETLCRLEHSYRVLEGRFDSLNQALGTLHSYLVDQAMWIWVVHDMNPHGLSSHVKGFKQAQSWFQDFTQVRIK